MTIPRQLACLLLGVAAATSDAASWQSTLTHNPPGDFAPLRSCRATYAFSWSGVVAATGEAHYTRQPSGEYVAEAQGGTRGLARMMWRYDTTFHSTTDGTAFRPIEMRQVEDERNKRLTTTNTFTRDGVASTRLDSRNEKKPPKTKHIAIPDLYDLSAAMLYLRSQPLTDKSSYRLVVFPETSAYLATVTVVGREKVHVHAGSYSAIRLDIQLNKIGKTLELEPHKKFKRATVWLSDDQDRVPVKIEAAVFVGSVTAELQSINFD